MNASQLSLQEVTAKLAEIDPAAEFGALVLVSKLRAKIGASKASFDKAMLALSRAGKLALHHHDYPSSVPAAERDAMISDGIRYYSGVAIRG